MAPVKRYGVGDTVFHADYGEGMVVGVKPRPFFDILEVAFQDGVRRLNSNHPRVGQKPADPPAAEAPTGGARPPRRIPRLRRTTGCSRSMRRPSHTFAS